MTVPVPLGVRIYNNRGKAFDVWVTRWVDDISFRSVVPGGFASAAITLHNDPEQPFAQLAQLYNRVQIVDLRSAEIAWEGRVDTVRRNSGDDSWELGCLGAMVCASDIQRPMFYIDSSLESWIASRYAADIFSMATDTDRATVKATFSENTWLNNNNFTILTWQRGEDLDVYVGRFDITYAGGGSNANLSRFAIVVDVTNGAGASPQTRVDVTTLTTAATRKSNVIGAAGGFTSTAVQRVVINTGNDSATTSTTTSDNTIANISAPRVQVQRVDRNGTKLTTSASYPNDFVTVSQVVEDVVGRFLVGAWLTSTNNVPYFGQVRPDDAYIDTSSTAQITHLAYWEGVTAAEILNDLMTAQPEAYWALWESKYGATDGAGGQSDWGHRFEWATWPASWGYQATSVDGLEEQPDGSALANFVFYQYLSDAGYGTATAGFRFLQNFWGTSNENQLLTDSKLVRAVTVRAEEPQSSGTAFTRAGNVHAGLKRTVNTGTLTVKRPIHFYDAGANSWSGASRMLDPWMIRPGKLIRITDIPPRSNSNTFNNGTSPFAGELDGTIFRVVSTTYNSSDNSCVLELDQVPAWNTATQIVKSGQGSSNLIVRG